MSDFENFKQRKANGWGMNLYRDKENGKIAGICAGLARHFDVEAWVIRLVFVAGAFFFQALAIFAYIGLIFVISNRNSATQSSRSNYEDSRTNGQRNKKQRKDRHMFQYEMNTKDRLKDIKRKLDESNSRIAGMERYVTSNRFHLDKEFSKLD